MRRASRTDTRRRIARRGINRSKKSSKDVLKSSGVMPGSKSSALGSSNSGCGSSSISTVSSSSWFSTNICRIRWRSRCAFRSRWRSARRVRAGSDSGSSTGWRTRLALSANTLSTSISARRWMASEVASSLTASSRWTCSISIEISTRSRTIDSTSRPTYPTSVNFVASTLMNGASTIRATRRAISVLPTPVGPIMRMFFG